jgi:hypothetical protein
MVAAMATLSGHEPEMTGLAEMASEAIEGWLHEYDGYRGLLVFTDQLASTIGVTVEEFEVYDVPVCDVVGEDVEGR